ncbi:MAG: ABC transporter permease [Pseudomonadota bacterium]
MEIVLLKTDFLLFVLLGLIACYWRYAATRAHLSAPWGQVAERPMAMAAAVVLATFLIVALLDSMHFHPRVADSDAGQARYSSQIKSVLDVVLTPIKNDEKTYSAPLAAHSFAKETIEGPDGSAVRDYPRLVHGASHLKDLDSHRRDVIARTLGGVLAGLLAWAALAAIAVALLAKRAELDFKNLLRQIMRGESSVPWRVILGAVAVIFALIGFVATVGPYYHILGTDKVGADVLYQGIKSVRTGLLIGTLTTLVMLPFAIVMGVAAGYFRGWVDDAIQYLYTTLSSIPGILLIAAAALMLEAYMNTHADDFANLAARADVRLLAICMILGVTTWTGLCRLLRGETLKLREIEYIQAASAFGIQHSVILARHIVPNIMHIIMISIVLDFSGLVLAEAVLTYVNIGVDPSMESWGNMINSARLELARDPAVWWSLVTAVTFMFTLVLAANIFADAVRDAFDPRLREMRAS